MCHLGLWSGGRSGEGGGGDHNTIQTLSSSLYNEYTCSSLIYHCACTQVCVLCHTHALVCCCVQVYKYIRALNNASLSLNRWFRKEENFAVVTVLFMHYACVLINMYIHM